MNHLRLSVIKINCHDGCSPQYTHLFEFIPTYEEANLLAQLAMSHKEHYEIIAILPGANIGITEHPKEYKEVLKLAEKYKYVKMGG